MQIFYINRNFFKYHLFIRNEFVALLICKLNKFYKIIVYK